MSKQRNSANYKPTKTGGEILITKLEANKRYLQKQEQIIIRLPKGSRDKIGDYLTAMREHYPNESKYSSVNTFVKNLLEEETGLSFDKEEKDLQTGGESDNIESDT